MGTYTILPASVEDVYAAGLIDRLDADILSRYPGEKVNGIDPGQFRAAGGYFAAARVDGCNGATLVGCGAFRPFVYPHTNSRQHRIRSCAPVA